MTAIGAQTIRPRIWRTAAIIGICGLSLASTVILYSRITEDWRSAAHYLITHAQPGDRVLYYQSVGEFAAENYRDWLPGGSAPRPLPVAVTADQHWQQHIDDAPRVWLVLYRAKASDSQVDQIQQSLEQREFRLDFVDLYPGVTVMEFVKQ
jgi:hypothetical protein